MSRHQRQQLSYHALDSLSTALAHGLARQAVRKGDRVAVSLGNSIEYALATYALFKLGAILVVLPAAAAACCCCPPGPSVTDSSQVPLNPSFNEAQVVSALAHLDASHLVISLEASLPRQQQPRSNLGLIEELVAVAGPRSLKKVVLVNNSRTDAAVDRSVPSGAKVVRFEDVCADGAAERGPLVPAGQVLDPDDIVNIQFTSGFVLQFCAAAGMRISDSEGNGGCPGRRVCPRLLV